MPAIILKAMEHIDLYSCIIYEYFEQKEKLLQWFSPDHFESTIKNWYHVSTILTQSWPNKVEIWIQSGKESLDKYLSLNYLRNFHLP